MFELLRLHVYWYSTYHILTMRKCRPNTLRLVINIQSSSLDDDIIELKAIDKAFDWLIINWCFLSSSLGIPVLPVVNVINAVSTSTTSLGSISPSISLILSSSPTLIGTLLSDGMIN